MVSPVANSYGAFDLSEHAISVSWSDGLGFGFQDHITWIELSHVILNPRSVHHGQRPSRRRAQSARAFSFSPQMQPDKGICAQDLIARDAHLHDALLAESQALQDIVLSEVSSTTECSTQELDPGDATSGNCATLSSLSAVDSVPWKVS